jgi:hypothetical protein
VEIMLKMVLNTINLNLNKIIYPDFRLNLEI